MVQPPILSLIIQYHTIIHGKRPSSVTAKHDQPSYGCLHPKLYHWYYFGSPAFLVLPSSVFRLPYPRGPFRGPLCLLSVTWHASHLVSCVFLVSSVLVFRSPDPRVYVEFLQAFSLSWHIHPSLRCGFVDLFPRLECSPLSFLP